MGSVTDFGRISGEPVTDFGWISGGSVTDFGVDLLTDFGRIRVGL